MMDWNLWKTFLSAMQPNTLAHIVIDIEDAQEDWEHYPEDAPPEDIQRKVDQVLGYVMKLGAEWGETADFDFSQMVEQIREEQPANDWLFQRNRQDQENWYEDYQ